MYRCIMYNNNKFNQVRQKCLIISELEPINWYITLTRVYDYVLQVLPSICKRVLLWIKGQLDYLCFTYVVPEQVRQGYNMSHEAYRSKG